MNPMHAGLDESKRLLIVTHNSCGPLQDGDRLTLHEMQLNK
jgi:hypothetical protein